MKKVTLLFLFFIYSISYSQEYYSVNKHIYNNEDFKTYLKQFEKNIKDKKEDYKVIFAPKKLSFNNDSIIKYGSIMYIPKTFLMAKWYEVLSKPLPNFKSEKFNGGYLTSKSLIGKPTIINFWFTQCVPCVEEMPNLNYIKKIHKDNINTISITFENRETVTNFLKKFDFDFEILIDSQKLIDKFGVNGFPQTILLDKNNIIRYIAGPIHSLEEKSNKILLNNLNNEILELLKE